MKNTKNTLLKWLLGACLMLVGVQSVCAEDNPVTCKGTVLFKAPDTWDAAYIGGFNVNTLTAMKKNAQGYYEFDLGTLGIIGNTPAFAIGKDKTVPTKIFTKEGIVSVGTDTSWPTNKGNLPCPGVEDGVNKVVYVTEDPDNAGKTYIGSVPPTAKFLHVLVPDVEEWQADQIMINIDGVKDTLMTSNRDLCGWVSIWFDEAPSSVYLYRKHDKTKQLGKGGLADAELEKVAEPIELSAYFSAFGTNQLYFMPDEDDWLQEGDGGWYTTDPGVPDIEDRHRCEFTLAALIYDTDQDLNALFSSDGDNIKDHTNGCLGVHPGLVKEDLDPVTKKPVFSGSADAVKCFGSEVAFNTLFNYTQGVNEVQCYDMPFRHYGADARWGYDSDSAVVTRKKYNYAKKDSVVVELVGGFSPLEDTQDEGVVMDKNGKPMGPLPGARKKRPAAGPVPTMDIFPMSAPNGKTITNFDYYCNTPGWDGGVDCKYQFESGTNPADFWCWGSYCDPNFHRWGAGNSDDDEFFLLGYLTDVEKNNNKAYVAGKTENTTREETRNQQFCFESHATFTYAEDQEFTFRGDDDIWVFINNKIAVDNGGAHLAAPGHVVLNKLNSKYTGTGWPMVPGKEYPLDIFFCDRRTTMSNVIIKTNMYIVQKTAINPVQKKDPKDKSIVNYEMCYTKSGDGSCSAAMTGSDDEVKCCGSDFTTKPECSSFTLQYYLIPGSDLSYDGKDKETLTNGMVHHGGIDLTNPAVPVVSKKKMVLGPGRWTLYVVIDNAKKKIASFRMAGEVDVVSGDAVTVYFDEDDKEITSKRVPYKFVKSAPAGPNNPTSLTDLVPVYISAIAHDENGKLLMQPDDAVGVSYSLDIPSGMRVFKIDAAGKFDEIDASKTLTIQSSGIDTVYAYVPASMMRKDGGSSQVFSLKVAGRTTSADITFYVPRLAFVDTLYKDAAGNWVFSQNIISGDVPDPETGKIEERLTGMGYNFFVVALKPADAGGYENCTECNFKFTTTGTSNGVDALDSVLKIVNGGAIIQIRSKQKYNLADDKAARIVVVGSSSLSAAQYTPIYFTDPPCPIPSFTDMFDVEGTLPTKMNLSPLFYDSSAYYQDGIADMVDIYYNRLIPKDSLPLAVCIEWESSTATKYYPAKDSVVLDDGTKVSVNSSETDINAYVLCNDVIYRDRMDTTTCNQTYYDGDDPVVDENGNAVSYCDQRIRVTGLALSKSPKTGGSGRITSFSAYKNRSGKTVTQGFPSEVIIDRMAPIPVSAIVASKKNGKSGYAGQDVLTITMSEPVKIVSADKFAVFDFYLYNARGKDKLGENDADLLSSPTEKTPYIVSAMVEVSGDDAGIVTAVYKTKDANGNTLITPIKDDYLRLSGTLDNPFWADKSDINLGGADSVRAIVKANVPDDKYLDETYAWNSPTGYNETKRLPSPWVEISGAAANGLTSNSFAYSSYAKTDTAAIVVNAYSKFRSDEEVIDKENGIPGWFVKADMLSLYSMLSDDKKAELAKTPDKIYFSYNLEVYTNLGGYVAGKSGRIYCDDKTNEAKNGRSYFGPKGENHNCLESGTNRNYYIGWNMISDEGRAVGSGAYISKISTFVKLGSKKDHEQSDHRIWGVKKSNTKQYTVVGNNGVVFDGEF